MRHMSSAPKARDTKKHIFGHDATVPTDRFWRRILWKKYMYYFGRLSFVCFHVATLDVLPHDRRQARLPSFDDSTVYPFAGIAFAAKCLFFLPCSFCWLIVVWSSQYEYSELPWEPGNPESWNRKKQKQKQKKKMMKMRRRRRRKMRTKTQQNWLVLETVSKQCQNRKSALVNRATLPSCLL